MQRFSHHGFLQAYSKEKEKVATYILCHWAMIGQDSMHKRHTTFDQWGGRKMSGTQSYTWMTDQMSCTILYCDMYMSHIMNVVQHFNINKMFGLNQAFFSCTKVLCSSRIHVFWFSFIFAFSNLYVSTLLPAMPYFSLAIPVNIATTIATLASTQLTDVHNAL